MVTMKKSFFLFGAGDKRSYGCTRRVRGGKYGTPQKFSKLTPQVAERLSLAVLALNVLGVIAYLLWASQTWVAQQEKGTNTTTPGDALVWGAFVLPLFAAFFILNLVWGSLIVFQKRWRTGRLWLTALIVWIIAVAVDILRHR